MTAPKNPNNQTTKLIVIPLLGLLPLLAACASDGGEGGDASLEPTVATPFAACTYANPFSGSPECREYTGERWDRESVEVDCLETWGGALEMDAACAAGPSLGRCEVGRPPGKEYALVFPGTDAAQCDATRTGCEVFAAGTFEPLGPCTGGTEPGGGPSGGPTVFTPPTLSCVPPLEGQDAGTSEGGEVCTWQAISACTEPGRKFADYGSCDVIRTQRPYYPRPPADVTPVADDPRLDDESFVTELAWVREQVEACACVCCHSDVLAVDGPANWFIEADGVWTDTLGPSGLALAAGWVDSTSFGAFPADENNGFDRSVTGFPSTDPARLQAFFAGELSRRGFGPEDFVDTEPFGGPLYSQLIYEPERCEDGVGIDADGTIRWTGGDARYLYVMDGDAANPLVPPNLDLPVGTHWRVDVAPESTPIESGLVYGRVPAEATQAYPTTGEPSPLRPGATYYLYVLKDVGIPITRCLFDAR